MRSCFAIAAILLVINQFVEVFHLSLRFGMVWRNRFMDETCFISELLIFVGVKVLISHFFLLLS